MTNISISQSLRELSADDRTLLKAVESCAADRLEPVTSVATVS